LKIKTSIIGLGKIGIKYDKNHKYNIGNYTSEVLKNKNLKLVSVSDISNSTLTRNNRITKNIFYNSIDDMLKVTNPDLVIVSSSTNSQYRILKKILKHCPKYIIVEKPVCNNSSKLKKIMKMKFKSKIYVNYIKRYNPIYENILNLIKKKKYGKVKTIKVSYSGDKLNIGSHAIDIINFLINEKIKFYKKINSFETKNFIFNFFLLNKKYEIELKNYKLKNLYIFKMEIIFEKGKLEVLNNETKVIEYKLVKSFKEYKDSKKYYNEFIERKIRNHKLTNKSSLSQLLKIVSKSKKKSNLANLKDAINVHHILEKIINK
jgi:predicted dehydrogenase